MEACQGSRERLTPYSKQELREMRWTDFKEWPLMDLGCGPGCAIVTSLLPQVIQNEPEVPPAPRGFRWVFGGQVFERAAK